MDIHNCVFLGLLMGIWVVSSLGLPQMKWLGTFLYSLCTDTCSPFSWVTLRKGMTGSCGWYMVNFLTCQTVLKKKNNNLFLKFRRGCGFSLFSWGYDFSFMLVVGQLEISFWGLFPITQVIHFFILILLLRSRKWLILLHHFSLIINYP